MKQQTTIQAAIAGLLALGFAAAVSAQPVPEQRGKDKCYGVAKAGQNDCGLLEVRRQGDLRKDRRQDNRAEVLILSFAIPRRPPTAGGAF